MVKPTWRKAPYDSTLAQGRGPHILKPDSLVRISASPRLMAAQTAASSRK
jgi:hypothetical protein